MTIIRKPGSHPVSERGSIAVLIAFLIPVMCLMVVLVASIGQLIYAKIRLQATANTCALAAASVQAAGLNEIADLNYDYQMELGHLKHIMKKTKYWYDEDEAEDCFEFYQDVLRNITHYQYAANRAFGERAGLTKLVEIIQEINLPESRLARIDVPDRGKLTAFKPPQKEKIYYEYYDSDCDSCRNKAYNWGKDPHKRNAYGPRWDAREKRMAHRKNDERDHVKIYKPLQKSGRTSVEVALALDIKGLVLGSSFLDAAISGSPTIIARAAAKPAGGNIYEGRPDYRPVLISTNP